MTIDCATFGMDFSGFFETSYAADSAYDDCATPRRRYRHAQARLALFDSTVGSAPW